MNKKWIFFAVILTAVVAASAAAYKKLSGPDLAQPPFSTETIGKRDISSSVQATGVIRAKIGAEVKVGARISGRVERLYANIGDQVGKGQLLARIEQEDLKARVNEARMNLRVVEANLDLSRKNLQRMQSLFEKGYVSRDSVDVAERDLKASEAQANQVREMIRFNETQMSYANIYAPIPGVIASVATQQGETVSASSLNVPTFVTIVDLNRLEIYAYVDETDIGKIKPGLAATFTVDSFPEREFTGRVTAVYPKATIQDNVVYYITIISIENPLAEDGRSPLLKPDMTVSAAISLNRREDVLAVPSRAIKREGGRKIVRVLENGKPVSRAVKTGWKDNSYTEVAEGLKAGDVVITGEAAKAESN